MGYGDIIKRAWRITWRYRALWVLGLFAGASGSSSGGGGGNYNFGSLADNSGSGTSRLAGFDAQEFLGTLEKVLPLIIVVTLGLVVIGIVWWILSVAARGGLVFAVNEIQEGRPLSLGSAWNAGFARFWSVFGLSVLLGLPVFVLALLVVALIALPLVIPLARGGSPSAAAFVPICGTMVIGVPLLMVLSIVLGLLNQLALRFVMLSGHGAVKAVGDSWRAFRTRFKDTALMWLIGVGLNLAAGFVIAIPLVIVSIAILVPAVVAAIAGQWAAFAGVLVVTVLLVAAISLAFTAVWGTFTSALWTVFFRRFTGMEVLPDAAQPSPPAQELPGPIMAPSPPPPPFSTASPTSPPNPPIASEPTS